MSTVKLIHTEIQLRPGEAPFPNPAKTGDGAVAEGGIGVLEIENTDEGDDNFSVDLVFTPPIDMNWLKMKVISKHALPMPTVYGSNYSSIQQVFVASGDKALIQLTFEADAIPEVRAGTYRFEVIVRSVLVGQALNDQRTITGTLIIRPYFRYDAYFNENTPPFKRFRRRRELELVIENHGNDFLYLDLKPVKSQTVSFVPLVQWIVVPPAENGVMFLRSVPVIASTTKKDVKGEAVLLEVAMPMVRRSAAHVPELPPPPGTKMPIPSAELHRAVLWKPIIMPDKAWYPRDELTAAPDLKPGLYYRPPIPTTLPQVGKWTVANAKGLVMMFIGLVAMGVLMATMYGNAWYHGNTVSLKQGHSKPGDLIGANSTFPLAGVKVFFEDAQNHRGESEFRAARKGFGFKYQFIVPNVPPGMYTVFFQRRVWPDMWPVLISNLWKIPKKESFTVDGDRTQVIENTSGLARTGFVDRELSISAASLRVEGFGSTKGTVTFDGVRSGTFHVKSWQDGMIYLDPLPHDLADAQTGPVPYGIVIRRADGSKIPFTLNISAPGPQTQNANPALTSGGTSGLNAGGGTPPAVTPGKGSNSGGDNGNVVNHNANSQTNPPPVTTVPLPKDYEKLVAALAANTLASVDEGLETGDASDQALMAIDQAANGNDAAAKKILRGINPNDGTETMFKDLAAGFVSYYEKKLDDADSYWTQAGNDNATWALPYLVKLVMLKYPEQRSALIKEINSRNPTAQEQALVKQAPPGA